MASKGETPPANNLIEGFNMDYNAMLAIYKEASDEAIAGGVAPFGLKDEAYMADLILDHFWQLAGGDAEYMAFEREDAIIHAAALQSYALLFAKAKNLTIVHINREAKTLLIEGVGSFNYPHGFQQSTQAFFESLQELYGECLFL
jgi:hypothetical protein